MAVVPPLFRILCLTLLGGCLQAADENYFGLQSYLALPQSDLKQWTGSSPGYGLGFHVLMDRGNGEAFRPRFEIAYFQGKPTLDVPVPAIGALPGSPTPQERHTLDNKFIMMSMGLDSLYYFKGFTDEGAYLFLGFGLTSTQLLSQVAPDPAGPGQRWPQAGTRFTDSSVKANLGFGGGYQLKNRFGVEVRLNRVRGAFGPANLWLTSVSLGTTYRFP